MKMPAFDVYLFCLVVMTWAVATASNPGSSFSLPSHVIFKTEVKTEGNNNPPAGEPDLIHRLANKLASIQTNYYAPEAFLRAAIHTIEWVEKFRKKQSVTVDMQRYVNSSETKNSNVYVANAIGYGALLSAIECRDDTLLQDCMGVLQIVGTPSNIVGQFQNEEEFKAVTLLASSKRPVSPDVVSFVSLIIKGHDYNVPELLTRITKALVEHYVNHGKEPQLEAVKEWLAYDAHLKLTVPLFVPLIKAYNMRKTQETVDTKLPNIANTTCGTVCERLERLIAKMFEFTPPGMLATVRATSIYKKSIDDLLQRSTKVNTDNGNNSTTITAQQSKQTNLGSLDKRGRDESGKLNSITVEHKRHKGNVAALENNSGSIDYTGNFELPTVKPEKP